jgi:hypothetical protein
MRIPSLAIVATSALLTLTAVGTASAQVVLSQTRVVSNGFETCRSSRQTEIGPFGAASQSARVCRSNFGGLGLGGGLGGVGLGGGGFGGGGININVRF